MKHEQSEALLGSIVYQLLSDPIRTVSLLTSLNSGATYTYEQKDEIAAAELEWEPSPSENILDDTRDVRGTDLDDFTWESKQEIEQANHKNEKEELDDLLGDFLAQMNK